MMPDTQISEALRCAIDSPTVERLAEVLSINEFGKSFSEKVVAILVPRLEAALAGHVVVPRIPSPEMIQAGNRSRSSVNATDNTQDTYRAMIDAARGE